MNEIPKLSGPASLSALNAIKTLEEVYKFMKAEVDSGDDALWTPEYTDLYELVEMAIINVNHDARSNSLTESSPGSRPIIAR